MAIVKISLAYRAPSLTAERFGKFDMVIPFTIDGAGPFDVRVPEENYTAEIGETAVRKTASAQVALKGRELTI